MSSVINKLFFARATTCMIKSGEPDESDEPDESREPDESDEPGNSGEPV